MLFILPQALSCHSLWPFRLWCDLQQNTVKEQLKGTGVLPYYYFPRCPHPYQLQLRNSESLKFDFKRVSVLERLEILLRFLFDLFSLSACAFYLLLINKSQLFPLSLFNKQKQKDFFFFLTFTFSTFFNFTFFTFQDGQSKHVVLFVLA